MEHDYTDPSTYGVVVVVYCTTTKQFLVLTEKKNKPAVLKTAGMGAFVSETVEPGDGNNVLVTARRAVQEEIGEDLIQHDDIFVREKPLESLAHDVRVYIAWVTVDVEFASLGSDPDVEYRGWFTEEEIRHQCQTGGRYRIETLPSLDAFKRGREGA